MDKGMVKISPIYVDYGIIKKKPTITKKNMIRKNKNNV